MCETGPRRPEGRSGRQRAACARVDGQEEAAVSADRAPPSIARLGSSEGTGYQLEDLSAASTSSSAACSASLMSFPPSR